jgi:hypothetical protein
MATSRLTPTAATIPTRAPTARAAAAEVPAAPAQLDQRLANEPLRQETVQADYTTTPRRRQRRRDHLDA